MKGTDPSSLRAPAGLAVLVAVAACALFLPAAGYDYVRLDDDQYVANNPRVATGLTARNIRWAFQTVYEDWWLPLLWMSYMADSDLYGPVPGGYHTTNILLHAANAGLLFWFLFRLTGSRWRSLFCAALFAFHPLRVESVAWITARKDVLSGLFFMLGLLSYLRHVERPSGARFGALAACMLLGLLSKAILIVLPFVLLLLDYWPLRRAGDPWAPGGGKAWRPLLEEKVPLFLLAGAFLLINLRTHVSGTGADVSISPLTRLGLIGPNYWIYLGKLLWPAHLAIYYPERDIVHWPTALAALAGLAALTLPALRCRGRSPFLLVGWLWFLVALFPVIRGVRLGLADHADRFLYLPGIGLGLALAWGAAQWAGRRRLGRAFCVAAGVLLLGLCAWRTRVQLPLWADSMTMFTHLVNREPDNDLANNSYGKALMERGRIEEALEHFARAAAANPRGSFGVVNYAEALHHVGRYDETIAWLNQALARGYPDAAEVNALLGMAHLNKGRTEEALPFLRKTVERRPDRAGWRIEFLRALLAAGKEPEAREQIRILQDQGLGFLRDAGGLPAHYAALWRDGEKAHAWSFFEQTIARQPDNRSLLNMAAWLLATDPAPPVDPEEAVRLARRALEANRAPDPSLLDTLAAAQAAAGRFDEAILTAEEALRQAGAAGQEDLVRRMAPRLQAYRERRPWREGRAP